MTASDGQNPPQPERPAPTVLVVDDEAGTRALIRATVESTGCQVLEAGDSDTALRLARENHPDLVLLDIVLPGSTSSGVMICQELIEELHIPVVIVSGSAHGSIARSCLAMGAVEILRKPFHVDDLREKLPGWLPD